MPDKGGKTKKEVKRKKKKTKPKGFPKTPPKEHENFDPERFEELLRRAAGIWRDK